MPSSLRGFFLTLVAATLLPPIAGSAADLPAVAAGAVRIATFNVQELNWKKLQQVDSAGRGTEPQLLAAAAILRTVRPDIVLLNEIDYTGPVDAEGAPPADRDAARAFVERYLQSERAGLEPLDYAHRYYGPCNTGAPSDVDLNGDGQIGGPEDAFGFGRYPGEYSMVLLSRFPIDATKVRTFRKLLWKDLPDNTLPDGTNGKPAYYKPDAVAAFRLSSKSHWDVPIEVHGREIHFLCSHPTPPVFDGDEDRNGRRNFDELRFWGDYLTGGDAARWIVDDRGGRETFAHEASFMILGDLNAEPVRYQKDFDRAPIDWVLKHPRVLDPQPTSPGAEANGNARGLKNYLPYRTNDFGRLDYVLPSRDLTVKATGVFWPAPNEPLAAEAKTASDHRLVWCDVIVPLKSPGK